VVGLGPRDELDSTVAFRAASAAARTLAGRPRAQIAFELAGGWSEAHIEAGICGSLVGCCGSDLYRAQKKRTPPAEVLWSGIPDELARRGQIVASAVNLARRLVNEPPSELDPERFAAIAGQVAQRENLTCEVWDVSRLEAERCGALLAVGRGSSRPPRLVILRYFGGLADDAPLALVGKGVTFDSGGLSLKPTDGMKTMKCDMAGAAAVLAALQAIAQLRLPLNVIGLCGLVENMISGSAYKLGDVLRARSGKTIEVLNTDAEGRLVLADVLDVARQFRPSRLLDLATLTGACVVALGTDVAGLMTNDPPLGRHVQEAAQAAGEAVWPLPMFPEFAEQLQSDVADLRNVGEGRWAGAILAAKFLEEFVGGTPWVHLDIAGPAFLESPKPWLDPGGTGFGVRTVVETARRLASGQPI
jgi:leucyl aminopeptidase